MKPKKLPHITFSQLSNARNANATLSLPPGTLGTSGRKPSKGQAIADLVGAKGDEFSKEYISSDRTRKDILKSDKYVVRNNKYIEVKKKNYPHHRISDPEDIEQRLRAIIKTRQQQNMYYPKIYQGRSNEDIKQTIIDDGFNPQLVHDKPSFTYETHTHSETALLAFLNGEMDVTVEKATFHCTAGDKIIIPGGKPHSGIVGKNGCEYFWSEKII